MFPYYQKLLAVEQCKELQREAMDERRWNRLRSHKLNRIQHRIWLGLRVVSMIGMLLLTSLPLVPALPSTIVGIPTDWFEVLGVLVGALIFVRASRAYRAAGYFDPMSPTLNKGIGWVSWSLAGLAGMWSNTTHAYGLQVMSVVIINTLLIIAFVRCLAALHRLRV